MKFNKLSLLSPLNDLMEAFAPKIIDGEIQFHKYAGYKGFYMLHSMVEEANLQFDPTNPRASEKINYYLKRVSENLIRFAPYIHAGDLHLFNQHKEEKGEDYSPSNHLRSKGNPFSFWNCLYNTIIQYLYYQVKYGFQDSTIPIEALPSLLYITRSSNAYAKSAFNKEVIRHGGIRPGVSALNPDKLANIYNINFTYRAVFFMEFLENQNRFKDAKTLAKSVLSLYGSNPTERVRSLILEYKRFEKSYHFSAIELFNFDEIDKEEKLVEKEKVSRAKKDEAYWRYFKHKGLVKFTKIVHLYMSALKVLDAQEEIKYLEEKFPRYSPKKIQRVHKDQREWRKIRGRKKARNYGKSLRLAAEKREQKRALEIMRKKEQEKTEKKKSAIVIERTAEEKLAEALASKEQEEKSREERAERAAQLAKLQRIDEENSKREAERSRSGSYEKEGDDSEEEDVIIQRAFIVEDQKIIDTYRQFWEIQSFDPVTKSVHYRNPKILTADFTKLLAALDIKTQQTGSHITVKISNTAVEVSKSDSSSDSNEEDSKAEEAPSSAFGGGGGGGGPAWEFNERGEGIREIEYTTPGSQVRQEPEVAESQTITFVAGRDELDKYIIDQVREKFLNMGWDAETLQLDQG